MTTGRSGIMRIISDEESRTRQEKRMGHSVICLNLPQRPVVWTSRSSKTSFCITALLAFAFGIGVGVFIPLYFLPTNSSLFSATEYEIPPPFTLTPQSVIEPVDSIDKRTLYLTYSTPSYPNSNSNNNINNNVQNRFNRFASTTTRTTTTEQSVPKPPSHPTYRRPTSSSVKFIVPDVKVLSLDPITHDQDSVLHILASRDNIVVNNNADDSDNNPDDLSSKIAQHDSMENQLLNGIYWSDQVEQRLPKGFNNQDMTNWRTFVKNSTVSSIQEGCGRMQNRLLSFTNGTRACCRYRHNFDQIQGEIFGFYLSQILKIQNLAPSALDVIQPSDKKWKDVQDELSLAQWVDEKPVVLTRFIDSLSPAYIPTEFRGSNRRLHPIDLVIPSNSVSLEENKNSQVIELAQWSDLIVFDYLTANLDRMVNNLYNLQWNPSMMEAPAHNLAKDPKTGLLIFLDNESGLLHGYRLLDKYEQYHRIMLDSLCVFRKSTAEAIKRLRKERNVGALLKKMFSTLEPNLLNFLPMIPDKSIKILNHRIDRVYDQITKCESLYTFKSEMLT